MENEMQEIRHLPGNEHASEYALVSRVAALEKSHIHLMNEIIKIANSVADLSSNMSLTQDAIILMVERLKKCEAENA